MGGNSNNPVIGDVLRHIYEGTAAATGDEFFRALVRSTAAAMGTRYAFVSEFAGSRTRVRTIVFWNGKGFGDNFEYDLDGTVCEGVLQGNMGYYPQGVAALFPREKALETMGIEGYLAVPMVDAGGEVLGHLAVFDTRAMHYSQRELEVFQIFGQRTAAELSRNYALRKLAASEARLSSILNNAMDAVITIDSAHRILLFNAAAERLFHCAAGWALDQPIDRFLSANFRQIIEARIQDTALREQPVWAPEGLTALRADGESFSIDVTLSPPAGRRAVIVHADPARCHGTRRGEAEDPHIAGGKAQPGGNAAAQLRQRRDRGRIAAHTERPRAGECRRTHPRECAAGRRDRYRQGTDRARGARGQLALQPAVHLRELCRAAAGPDRERAVWS